MMGTARIMTSASGSTPCVLRFNWVASTCTCRSIRPGISVRPAASITRAEAELMGVSDTSLMTPSSTRTWWPSNKSACKGSSRFAFLNSTAAMRISLECDRDQDAMVLI
ncbi:hypothetical protein D3C72_1896130 [compost metagenome]